MDEINNLNRILELLPQPVFCVQNGSVLCPNHAARQLFIETGLPIDELLGDAKEDYAQFDGSAMYLQLALPGMQIGACVTRMDGFDIFVTEQAHTELQAMALAAQQFRQPLSDVMSILNRTEIKTGTAYQGELHRGLFQMKRLVLNMSDAARYATETSHDQVCMNICSVTAELFEKIELLAAGSGITLIHSCPREPILTMLNEEKLERALYNMISNAMKVTPKGGTIEASLSCSRGRLYLSVRDHGGGIPQEILGSVYTRFLRQPSLNHGEEGLGLGMSLIRSAAIHHGGSVLIAQPKDGGTKITMSLSIRKNPDSILRSNILSVDYAGYQDHGLIELSDILPADLYRKDS
jgi:signal transduction histidine kinase